MNISTLEKRDLERINAIVNNPKVAYILNFKTRVPIELTYQWFEDVLKKRKTKQGECFVYRDKNGKLIGWVYVYEKKDLDEKTTKILEQHCGDERKMWLSAVVIDSEHSRKGYGTLLMKFVEEHFMKNQIKYIALETRSDNIAAQKFYECLGYDMIGRIPNKKQKDNCEMTDQIIYLKILLQS